VPDAADHRDATSSADVTSADVTSTDGAAAPAAPVVDFPRTLRRLRVSLLTVGALVALGWVVGGAVGDGWSLRLLAELVGFGLLASFLVEFVVVGGSAARGLLRAGERGDRLASADVSMLPPQLSRRRQR
jgi:hypothetical protein